MRSLGKHLIFNICGAVVYVDSCALPHLLRVRNILVAYVCMFVARVGLNLFFAMQQLHWSNVGASCIILHMVYVISTCSRIIGSDD